MTSDFNLDLQIACTGHDLPEQQAMEHWLQATLSGLRERAEVTVRIVERDESRQLNHQYRHKDSATNVLSFPADLPAELDIPLLGDLVICAPVVNEEARQQDKTHEAHWAHMLVHGTLHLLGYDHINHTEADIMEQLETDILTKLGFPPPYDA